MNRFLTVNRLEFVVTYLCNSRCRHCQLGDTKAKKYPSSIRNDLAVEIVRKVAGKHHPGSVMTFGGEPLLFPEIVCAIYEEAARSGIPLRQVITNGFWSDREDRMREVANNLAKSGVNRVAISVDCFHQDHIPLTLVKKSASTLIKAGVDVSWDPCWVISREHDNPCNLKTKAILETLQDLPIEEHRGNTVQPRGRALSFLSDYMPPKQKIPSGKCGELPYTEKLDRIESICIEPDGQVAVCNGLYIGNASEKDIIDILEDYDPYRIPEAKAIIEGGMERLADWANRQGVQPDPEGYYDTCHICTELRQKVRERCSG